MSKIRAHTPSARRSYARQASWQAVKQNADKLKNSLEIKRLPFKAINVQCCYTVTNAVQLVFLGKPYLKCVVEMCKNQKP